MFKVNNRSTRRCSGVFIVNFEYTWHVVQAFFLADIERVNARWNTLLP